jgi:SAM-dependent methyltransferase
MPEKNTQELVQEKYQNTPTGTRPEFAGDTEKAASYYQDFVNFVTTVSPAPKEAEAYLLDIGCGCGWSSFEFAKSGYKTTGIDLNAKAFEPFPTEGLTLLESSALDLPFPNDSFDIVASYQCIEHIPQPQTALLEMVRVCKPGGVICIVSPNLLSPILPIKFIIDAVRRGDLALKRTSTTPHHPYGNTLGETLVSIPITTSLLLRKLISSKVIFNMRTPDTVPPFHADNDACYICNPTDLLKFFPTQGCQVEQNGRHGRFPLSYLLAGGTWVAARKILEQ